MLYVSPLGDIKTVNITNENGDVLKPCLYWENAIQWSITLTTISEIYKAEHKRFFRT